MSSLKEKLEAKRRALLLGTQQHQPQPQPQPQQGNAPEIATQNATAAATNIAAAVDANDITTRPPLPELSVPLNYVNPKYVQRARAPDVAAAFVSDLAAKRMRRDTPCIDVVGTAVASVGSVDDYVPEARISEGVYGVVIRARHVASGKLFALKQIKSTWAKDAGGGFFAFLLREFDLLLRLRHPHVVRGIELKTRADRETGQPVVYIVMEHCPRDLKDLIYHEPSFHLRNANAHPDAPRAFLAKAKEVTRQMLAGLAFLHSAGVIHRDVKTSNFVIAEDGTIKYCDFGLARFIVEGARLSPNVVTLMYRAPELHFGVPDYGRAVDVWSVGCIMAELFLKTPLFRATCEAEHFQRVCDVLGMPSNATFPGLMHLPGTAPMLAGLTTFHRRCRLAEVFAECPRATARTMDADGLDLLRRLLAWNPRDRISAADALQHAWLTSGVPPCPASELLAPLPQEPTNSSGSPRHPPASASSVAAAAVDGSAAGGVADQLPTATTAEVATASAAAGAESDSSMSTPSEASNGSLRRALQARGDDSAAVVADTADSLV